MCTYLRRCAQIQRYTEIYRDIQREHVRTHTKIYIHTEGCTKVERYPHTNRYIQRYYNKVLSIYVGVHIYIEDINSHMTHEDHATVLVYQEHAVVSWKEKTRKTCTTST